MRNFEEVDPNQSMNSSYKQLLFAGGFLLLFAVVVQVMDHFVYAHPKTLEVIAPKEDSASLTLADGSLVKLHPGSVLHPEKVLRDTHQLHLEGTAVLEVGSSTVWEIRTENGSCTVGQGSFRFEASVQNNTLLVEVKRGRAALFGTKRRSIHAGERGTLAASGKITIEELNQE